MCLGTDADPDSRTRVLGEATTLEMNGLSTRKGERGNTKIALLPTERQAVPMREAEWDYSMAKRRWDRATLPGVFWKGPSECTLRL